MHDVDCNSHEVAESGMKTSFNHIKFLFRVIDIFETWECWPSPNIKNVRNANESHTLKILHGIRDVV